MTINPPSTPSTPDTPPPAIEGRTVREIVEHNHALVNEPWCRRIFRQLLQSLEVQYGMRMPHRRISPDTIMILDAGDPMLLPDGGDPAQDERIVDDLRDLAATIHYAITLELIPEGPLRGRALPGYSDSFLAAIDRCMSPDPEQRPRNIEELRNLLGIVVLGPPAALTLPGDEPPAPVRITEVPRKERPGDAALVSGSAARRNNRWPLWIMAAIVVVGAVIALALLLRQTDSSEALALSVPELAEPSSAPPAAADPEQALVTLPQPNPAVPEGPVLDEAAANVPTTGVAAAPQNAAPPTAVQLAPKGTPPGAAVAGSTYKLVIQPWGTVVVDGIERGASPPLKHLTLPPGEHTIRIVNPSFPEHTVTVQSVKDGKGVIELDFTEEKTP
ncbi:hypothetical protein [Massilia sp. YIM B02443]|uniref:hypothetical protein n=1 Tax=Massilia sp. YIM B02443 TaxID=3050127 RepID=UPI0025B63067|nr:hypothetical protein [Massilia sp. YIM B02443]MDN4038480.1 hypothetical protein [Massilia sp. YIM B02443]